MLMNSESVSQKGGAVTIRARTNGLEVTYRLGDSGSVSQVFCNNPVQLKYMSSHTIRRWHAEVKKRLMQLSGGAK